MSLDGQEREALDLWFCPVCGALLNNSNYKVDETQSCRGKRHRALAVKRRYVRAALTVREEAPRDEEQAWNDWHPLSVPDRRDVHRHGFNAGQAAGVAAREDTERADAICVEPVSADQLEAGDMVLAGDRPHVLVGDREMHYQGADPPTIWLGDFRDKGVVDGWGQIWRVVRDTEQEPER